MSIRLFNNRRAGQVVAFFALKNANHRINYMKALKLVYLADRESILKCGAPILDDDVRFSLPHGPVNSYTKDFLTGDIETEGSGWAEFISDKDNYEIKANCSEKTELDELSEADLSCLQSVWDRFGHMDQWQIRDWTHDSRNIPEWEDPNGGANIIPLERIMRACGVPDYIEKASDIESMANLRNMLSPLN